MTFAAGEKLGPYEIVGPIGAGGMGEVYRARDARLGREVAIKDRQGKIQRALSVTLVCPGGCSPGPPMQAGMSPLMASASC